MTADEANRELRRLTDAYFSGAIDRERYLRERGELLDRLVGVARPAAPDDDTLKLGNVELPGALASSASADDAEDTRRQRRAPGRAEAATPPAPPATRPFDRIVVRLAAGAAAAVLLVVLLITLWPDGSPPQPTENVVTEAEPGADPLLDPLLVQPAVAETELDRVRRYMGAPLWTDDGVESFVFDWHLLSTSEREALRASPLFESFVEEVAGRLKLDELISAEQPTPESSPAEWLSVELELGLVEPRESTPTVQPAEPAQPAPEVAVQPTRASDRESRTAPAPAPQPPVSEPDSGPAARVERANPRATAETAAVATLETPRQTPRPLVEPKQPAAGAAEPGPAAAPADPVLASEAATASTSPRVPSDRPCGAERLNFRSATCWDMLAPGVRGPIMRVLPAGTFQMGQADDPAASPVHEQKIERVFAIGSYEVTVAEFEYYCAMTGSSCPERRWSDEAYPIVDISWRQAVAYTNWLTEVTGAKYRLPTEAEWEYAARAGSSSLYPFGDSLSPTYAKFDNGYGRLAPLPTDDKTTRRNEFRLWHVAGNVREWTVDPWRENYAAPAVPDQRVVRGGSYAQPADQLRSAARDGEAVDYYDSKTGLRVVRELD